MLNTVNTMLCSTKPSKSQCLRKATSIEPVNIVNTLLCSAVASTRGGIHAIGSCLCMFRKGPTVFPHPPKTLSKMGGWAPQGNTTDTFGSRLAPQWLPVSPKMRQSAAQSPQGQSKEATWTPKWPRSSPNPSTSKALGPPSAARDT